MQTSKMFLKQNENDFKIIFKRKYILHENNVLAGRLAVRYYMYYIVISSETVSFNKNFCLKT